MALITGSPPNSAYVGEVLNGVRHGYGTYRCLASGVTYTGQWVAGRRQGKVRRGHRAQAVVHSQPCVCVVCAGSAAV